MASETIRCLLDAGANINAQDKNGAAPLHPAVRTRCAAAVRCLLKAGSDPALKNKSGATPFHNGTPTLLYLVGGFVVCGRLPGTESEPPRLGGTETWPGQPCG